MIRVATPQDDLQDVIALDAQIIGDNSRSAFLTQRLEAGDVFVFRDKARIAGFACLDPNCFFARRFLSLLMVAPDAQRQGIGAAQLAHLAKQSAQQLWTSTNQSNAPMRALLDRAGFDYCGTIQGLDPDDPELFFRAPGADL